jgi:hypothetical protein
VLSQPQIVGRWSEREQVASEERQGGGVSGRDDNLGTGTGMIFYPRVVPVSDPNQDGYGTSIFSHPWVTRRVPDTLLPL